MSLAYISNLFRRIGRFTWSTESLTYAGLLLVVILILAVLISAGVVYYVYPYRAEREPSPVAASTKILDEKRLESLMALLKTRQDNYLASSTISIPPAFR